MGVEKSAKSKAVAIRPPRPPSGRRSFFGNIFTHSPEKRIIADLRKTTDLLENKEKDLNDQEKMFNAMEGELEAQNNTLRKHTEKIIAREKAVISREKQVEHRERNVQKIEDEKAELLKERDQLERDIQSISLKLLKQKEALDDQAKAIRQRKLDAQQEWKEELARRKSEDQSRMVESMRRLGEIDGQTLAKKKELAAVQRTIDHELERLRLSQNELARALDGHQKAKQELLETEALLEAKDKALIKKEDEIAILRKDIANRAKNIDAREAKLEGDLDIQEKTIKKKYDALEDVLKGGAKEYEKSLRKKYEEKERALIGEIAKTEAALVAREKTHNKAFEERQKRHINEIAASENAIKQEFKERQNTFNSEMDARRKELQNEFGERKNKLVGDVAAREKACAEGEATLKDGAKEYEKSLRKKYEEKERALIGEIDKRESSLKAREKACQEQEIRITTSGKTFENSLKKAYEEKERAILDEAEKIEAKLEARKSGITKEIEAIERSLRNKYEDKERALVGDIEKREAALDAHIKAENKAIADRKNKIMKDLDALQNATGKDIAERERKVIEKELVLARNADEIKGLHVAMRHDRDALSQVADGRKAEFEEARIQWDEQMKDLKTVMQEIRGERTKAEKIVRDDLVELTNKENEIVTTSTHLQKDTRKLRDEENAIIHRIASLEKAETDYHKRKSLFDRKIDEFAKREAAITEKETLIVRGLKDVEAAQARANALAIKVGKSKEAKANVKMLEHKQAELSKSVAKLANKLIIKSQKINIPAGPAADHAALAEHPSHVAHETRDPMPKKLHALVEHDPSVLIEKARQAINAADFATAEKTIEQAEKLVHKLHRSNEKRDMNYVIWDLKTSLRLAKLS